MWASARLSSSRSAVRADSSASGQASRGRQEAGEAEDEVGVGEARVRQRVARIALDGLLEAGKRAPHPFAGEAAPEVAPLQVRLGGQHVGGVAAGEHRAVGAAAARRRGRARPAPRPRPAPRTGSSSPPRRSRSRPRPSSSTRTRCDGHPHPVPAALDRPFDHRVHAQVAAGLARVGGRVHVLEDGAGRPDHDARTGGSAAR